MWGFEVEDGQRWAIIVRVSSSGQSDSASREVQKDQLMQAMNKGNGELIKIWNVVESADTVDREPLNEALTLAENDMIDVLGSYRFDRLSRAEPWESASYCNELRNAGVTLYLKSHGYFDWEKTTHFDMLTQQMAFSHRWLDRIKEGGRDGQLNKLTQGKWAFGEPYPLGYGVDDDGFIRLTKEGSDILPEIVNIYLECENAAKTSRKINNMYRMDVNEGQVRRILDNEIIIGNLTLTGEVVATREKLRVVSPEKFEKVQDIREENARNEPNARSVPEHVDRVGERTSPQYLVDTIDCLQIRCKNCGSEVTRNGTIDRHNTTVPNIKCKNENCGYQGPLLTMAEYERLNLIVPLRCPCCPNASQLEVEENPEGRFEYIYYCQVCENQFGLDMSPDEVQRAREHPDLRLEWRTSQSVAKADSTRSKPDSSVTTRNHNLDEYLDD